jgi:hypothetical protein
LENQKKNLALKKAGKGYKKALTPEQKKTLKVNKKNSKSFINNILKHIEGAR